MSNERSRMEPLPRPPSCETARIEGFRRMSNRLRRLPMIRAGLTTSDRDADLVQPPPDAPLSPEGRRQVEVMTHFWEWAEIVVSSPARRARETAEILAPEHSIVLDDDLRPRDLGPWEGRTASALEAEAPDAFAKWSTGDPAFEVPGAEPFEAHAARITRFLERAFDEPYASVLVVSHRSVIRTLAALLVAPLPTDRPFPSEMVLLTRQEEGLWKLGRETSDPPPLRSPLERTGLSGWPDERPPEHHVAPLQVLGRELW